METTVLQKMSLYDILSQLIPGWVLVMEICYWLPLSIVDVPIAIKEILCVIVGYVVGLVLHTMSEWVWNHLRCKCKYWKARNNEKSIVQETNTDMPKSKMPFVCTMIPKEWENSVEQHLNDILDKYYEAYYYVCTIKQHGGVISALERQIAFVRAMIIPLLLGGLLCHQLVGIHCGYTILIDAVMLIVSGLFMHNRQHKIYQLVWEDYEYLKRLYADDKDNSQQDKNVPNKK